MWESRLAHGNKTLKKVKIMRTKTVLLSALLGALGSVSVMAQTNVYSLNAVGYINVTLSPGYNIVSCPLWATDPSGATDNTISNLLGVNTNGQYKKWQIYGWNGAYITESGTGAGWVSQGTNTINPGQAVWIENPSNATYSVTFVGTVPAGSNSVAINNGYNLISSTVPASGDMVTNSIMLLTNSAPPTKKDQIYTWNALTTNYTTYSALGTPAAWTTDPVLPSVGSGFWYYSTNATTKYWTEDYSVSNP
jgi:hypothetical protein